MSGILNCLESAGHVRRYANPTNRRSQRVELTDDGRGLVEEIAPDHFRRLAEAVGKFTPAERDTLRAAMGLLDRFGEVLRDERDS